MIKLALETAVKIKLSAHISFLYIIRFSKKLHTPIYSDKAKTESLDALTVNWISSPGLDVALENDSDT